MTCDSNCWLETKQFFLCQHVMCAAANYNRFLLLLLFLNKIFATVAPTMNFRATIVTLWERHMFVYRKILLYWPPLCPKRSFFWCPGCETAQKTLEASWLHIWWLTGVCVCGYKGATNSCILFHTPSPSSAPGNWCRISTAHIAYIRDLSKWSSSIWENSLCHLYQQLHGLRVNIIFGSIKSPRKTTWRKLTRKRRCCLFFKSTFSSSTSDVDQGKVIHRQEDNSLSLPHLICSTWRQKLMIGHKWLADASVLTCGLLQPYFLCFVTSCSCSFPTLAYVGLWEPH